MVNGLFDIVPTGVWIYFSISLTHCLAWGQSWSAVLCFFSSLVVLIFYFLILSFYKFFALAESRALVITRMPDKYLPYVLRHNAPAMSYTGVTNPIHIIPKECLGFTDVHIFLIINTLKDRKQLDQYCSLNFFPFCLSSTPAKVIITLHLPYELPSLDLLTIRQRNHLDTFPTIRLSCLWKKIWKKWQEKTYSWLIYIYCMHYIYRCTLVGIRGWGPIKELIWECSTGHGPHVRTTALPNTYKKISKTGFNYAIN